MRIQTLVSLLAFAVALPAATHTYVLSGPAQDIYLPMNGDAKFVSFVASLTIDDTTISGTGSCAQLADVGGSYFKLPPGSFIVIANYADGTAVRTDRSGEFYLFRDTPGLVQSYCSGGKPIGHTRLQIGSSLASSLQLEFDDAAPRTPAFTPPFAGAFASGLTISKGLFAFSGKDGDASASITCFAAAATGVDPVTTPCGSPPAGTRRPSVQHVYAYAGVARDITGIAGTASVPGITKVFGKIILDESLIWRTDQSVCNAGGYYVNQNDAWITKYPGSVGDITIVLPDGGTQTTTGGLPVQSVSGDCSAAAPAGNTRLVAADSSSQLDFTYADTAAQPAVKPPFYGILPAATSFKASTFVFQRYFPSSKAFYHFEGTLTCLAPMNLASDDPLHSACGDGTNVAGPPPAIQSAQGVVNGASFSAGIASRTWVTIRGTNLSKTTRTWQASDFSGSALPTSLDGVRVTINGLAAYVYYISPTQLNVLAPDDPASGPVPVVVINADGQSAAVTVTKSDVAPGLFAYGAQSGRYIVAQNASTYALIAPEGLLGSGVTTRPATPGETLTLYATGLGPTNPSYPTGQIIPAPAPLTNAIEVKIGGVTANTTFAGLVGSGLYQINFVVPSLATGDAAVTVRVGSGQSQANAYVPIRSTGAQSTSSAP